MAKKPNILSRAQDRRTAIKRTQRLPSPLDAATRAHVLELVREGATLAEICTLRGVTSYTRLYHTRSIDPVFDAEVRAAATMGAETAISEAQELSKAAAQEGNPDLMRVAESFARVSMLYAEKIAPREFGQLVKLGNHDGGPLSLQVVNYAIAASTDAAQLGKPQQLAVTPREGIADASFEELDPIAERTVSP